VTFLVHLLDQYGIAFVFAYVLVEQAGVPVPAYPVLLVAGSLVAGDRMSGAVALAAAVAACLLADGLWFAAGRRYGHGVLRRVCALSIAPESCVHHTESLFTRWGVRSLVLAKFIPGFATVATAMAGVTRAEPASFLLWDAIGSTLWAGIGIALGVAFAPAVSDLLVALEEMGRWGLLFLACCLALSIASKRWRRRQFLTRLRLDRISVDALAGVLQRGEPPVVVDVRPRSARDEGRIPGAIGFDDQTLPRALGTGGQEAFVVVYCDCPNEASAARVAKTLMARGFRRVRPLEGGMAAWQAAGLAIERAS